MLNGFVTKPGILYWVSGLFLWALLGATAFAQEIRTVAGDGTFGFAGDGGQSTFAHIADPVGVFTDSLGNLYVADTNNRRIRKIDTSGIITTIAGNGNFGFAGDGGQAIDASLADPTGVFVDGQGNVYIADTNNQRIRKVNGAGVITTIAGDGNAGFSGDSGQATLARVNFPTGVFVDALGNVFFADRENHRVRKVDTFGVISTVAGNGGFGSSGDGGQATSASLAFPASVFVDGTGNIYIADRFNYKIRKVDSSGVITTVAGNGAFGFSGDGGQATSASLAFPSGVYVDAIGNIYIADRDNHRIRTVDLSGVITTVAGNGTPTFGGDGGGATVANLNRPSGIWGDRHGAIWVADTNNRRIRKVAAPIYVSTPESGLAGGTSSQPGDEVVVFKMGITGDGTSTLSQVQVTLSDLSSATGLISNDFSALRLYESADAVLDGADVQIASLSSVPIGSLVSLVPSSTVTPVAEVERFYLVTAVLSSAAVDGHAFRMGFAVGGVTTSAGSFGQEIPSNDINRAFVDVVATRLVFTAQPAGSVSGQALSAQPVIVAQDDAGYVDRNFSEIVTLSLSQGAGQLVNPATMAVEGVATFMNVVYSASVDDESVVMSANDEDGVGTDLPNILSGVLTSDVIATQLIFTTQAFGSVSGKVLTTQPVVVAQDVLGLVDINFSDLVTLSENGAGTLTGVTVQAANGFATFTHVAYIALADGEEFTLIADDAVGGAEGNLSPIQANALTSDISATHLVFSTHPAGSVSGIAITTQPVVMALDDGGQVDIDFAETVVLSVSQGSGTLNNNSVQAVNGVAVFTHVGYTAGSDQESFVLEANDDNGVGSNLQAVQGNVLTCDVLATQLVFTTQPEGVVSGQPFNTQPVIVAQDSLGMVDTDFLDVVTLGENASGSLSNASIQALNGVAAFTNVGYTATVDGESFTLTADDAVGGAGGDLGAIESNLLTSNILATHLVFTTQPSGSVSGQVLSTQPVVMALDDSGRVDANFSETVTLLVSQGSGRLHNNIVQAVNGVAIFTDVVYVAGVDGESFEIAANDENGIDGDFPNVVSNSLTSDVLATHLIFATQPAGTVSGQALSTQPVVMALNDSGQVDIDFSDVVTLTGDGSGILHNSSLESVNGVATFTNILYTTSVDGESFTLTADDVVGGAGGDLGAIESNLLTSNILATHLVFTTQPSGSVSGQVLSTQPVVMALDDSGRVDTDFGDTVILSSSSGSLRNNIVQAVDGISAFTDLIFTATSDKQTLTLKADDESGGAEGDLDTVDANSLVSDVIAIELLYLVQPNGSVNGRPFTTQPVVVAVDSTGLIDIDFKSVVALSVEGQGSVMNASQMASSGIVTFTQVIHETDGSVTTFRLVASGGNLVSAASQELSPQVIATQLVFTVQPAGSVNGMPLLVQPIVEARDSLGQIDRNFSDVVTLAVNGSGGLTGQTVVAHNGRAAFSDLVYRATSDQEAFSIRVDDEVGGGEGDLPGATSNTIINDVVATRLVYVVQPSGSVSGHVLSVQPQLAAVDSLGTIDQGFSEMISISTMGAGTLTNQDATMQNGVATFVGLTYSATLDGEAFVLTANDQVTGLDLAPIDSDVLTCDVVATHLVFSTQPSGSVSGQAFIVQPEITAVDSFGLVDTGFMESVTLTTQTSGILTNIVVALDHGVGKSTALTFTATQDHQPIVLVANDATGGIDLALVRSDTFVCDVVASGLIFDVQPKGAANGAALSVQPIVKAQDGGVVDIDFDDVIFLSSDGEGTLIGEPLAAVSGVATFNGLAYVAGQDRESVHLIANDTAGGTEGDLPQALSSPFITDVIATHLRFRVTPSGIISGHPFLTQPEVVAVDSFGVVDVDFEGPITLTTDGGGQLLNVTLTAIGGVGVFTQASYTATSGLETFVIQADDSVGERDLLPAFSEVLTAGAGPPHHLGVFGSPGGLVADGVSSQSVIVRVLDQNNNPRLDDASTRVSLLVQGAAIGGGTQIVRDGEIAFDVISKVKAGTVYLQVSADGLLGAVDSFQTVAGKAQTLAIVFDTTPMLADGVSSREIRLQLLDAQGNLLTQDNSTLVALGVSGAAKEGGGTQAVKGGEAVFVILAGNAPGLIHLRANTGGLSEATAGLIVGAVRPDLTIALPPSGPDIIGKSESHTIQVQIQNTGLDTVRNAFDVVVMLVGGADSISVGRTVVSAPVAPDSVFSISVSFTVPSFSFATLASDYHWVAIVDAGGFVQEHLENNNISRGNTVAFPELSISPLLLDFETVVSDSVFEKVVLLENRGRAELRLVVTASDSQRIIIADSVLVLRPGSNRLLPVRLIPSKIGPFEGQLIFVSNDPKGDIVVDVIARVAAPNVVLLDLDPAVGNQHLTVLETGRDKIVEVELFLDNLPALQAVSIDLRYDPQLLSFETDSWVLGGYFVGGVSVIEEAVVSNGIVRLSGGALGNLSVAPDMPLGRLRFSTPSVLPTDDTVLATQLDALQIRFLQEDGVRDSLEIQATVNVVYKTQAIWPDLDGDGVVAFSDFLIFIFAFKQNETSAGWNEELPNNPFPFTPYRRFDIDGDGQVGFFDFVTYAQDFKNAQSQP